MKKIIDLRDNKRLSHAAIQRQYSWYRRQHLSEFRRNVATRGSTEQKLTDINNYVNEQAESTKDNGLFLGGRLLRD